MDFLRWRSREKNNIMRDESTLVNNLLDNWDSIIAIIIAGIVLLITVFEDLFKTIFDIQDLMLEKIINSTIISLLLLVVIGLFREKKDRNKVLNKLDSITVNTDTFLIRGKFLEEVKEIINSSNVRLVCHMRSGSVIDQLFTDFKKALERGCKIEIILCKHSEHIIKILTLFSYRNMGPNGIDSKLKSRVSAIRELKEFSPDNFLVREVDFQPSSLKYFSDPLSDNGKAFIVPISFQEDSRSAPSIMISNKKQPMVFAYYLTEFQKYWDHDEAEDFVV